MGIGHSLCATIIQTHDFDTAIVAVYLLFKLINTVVYPEKVREEKKKKRTLSKYAKCHFNIHSNLQLLLSIFIISSRKKHKAYTEQMFRITFLSLIVHTAQAFYWSTAPLSHEVFLPRMGRELLQHRPNIFQPPYIHANDVRKMFDSMRSEILCQLGGNPMRSRYPFHNPFDYRNNLLSPASRRFPLEAPLLRQLSNEKAPVYQPEVVQNVERPTHQQLKQSVLQNEINEKSEDEKPMGQKTNPDLRDRELGHSAKEDLDVPTIATPTPDVIQKEETSNINKPNNKLLDEKHQMRRLKQEQYRKAQETKRQHERERAQRDLERRMQMEKERDDFIFSIEEEGGEAALQDNTSRWSSPRQDDESETWRIAEDREDIIML